MECSLSPERFTKSNLWILPIYGLRVGREQHVTDSFNHSLYLIKVFRSSSPEGNGAERNVTNDLHVSIATSHGNVIFRVLTLMLSLKPQPHSNTAHHTTTTPTHTTSHGDRDRLRQRQKETTQRKTREDCKQLATLRESWLPITHACLEFLTTLTLRALHEKSLCVSTISDHRGRRLTQKTEKSSPTCPPTP